MSQKTNKAALHKYTLHIYAFILPAIIMIAVLIRMGFFPFGNQSLFIMDMQDQYLNFFASLKDLVSGDSSLFFSWSKGMGQNYIGLFAYYLASPLSFITLFFSREMLPLGIVVLTIIKISLCGVTLSVYLDKVFNENRFIKLIFTTCYALMSYNLVYSMSLMWLDAVILLPIILFGIDSIVTKERGTIFTVSIGIMFICNYYIAFSISVFCIIYYFFRWFSLHKVCRLNYLIKNLLKIVFAAIAGIGLSAWLLIPVVKDLSSRGVGGKSQNTFNYSFFDVFMKFTPNNYDSITYNGKPSIYCGIIIVLLVVIFFFNRKIALKIRLMSAGIFLIFLVSFWITPLDEFWHGMQSPNWFPFRYAYLFSFFMILTAYTQLAHMELKKIRGMIPGAGFLVMAIVCVDLYFNAAAMLNGLEKDFKYQNVNVFDEYYHKTSNILSDIKEEDGEFYRIEKDYQYSKNDAMFFGYNGVTHYSSTYYKNLNDFTRALGMSQAHFYNSYTGSSPVTDSVFGVKYIMAMRQHTILHNKIKEYDGVILYENNDCLPVGFAVQNDAMMQGTMTENPFQNQNSFLNSLTGMNGNVFHELAFDDSMDEERKTAVYRFKPVINEPVYIYINGAVRGGSKKANVFVDGTYLTSCYGRESSAVLYVGTFQTDDPVEIRFETADSDRLEFHTVFLSYMNSSYFKESIKVLKRESFYETKKLKNGLNARLDTDQDKICFTSIPFQNGFTVRINGKKVTDFAYENTFLAFPVPEGENVVEIRFVSPGFFCGFAVTLLTFIVLLLKMVLSKYYGRHSKKQCRNI